MPTFTLALLLEMGSKYLDLKGHLILDFKNWAYI